MRVSRVCPGSPRCSFYRFSIEARFIPCSKSSGPQMSFLSWTIDSDYARKPVHSWTGSETTVVSDGHLERKRKSRSVRDTYRKRKRKSRSVRDSKASIRCPIDPSKIQPCFITLSSTDRRCSLRLCVNRVCRLTPGQVPIVFGYSFLSDTYPDVS